MTGRRLTFFILGIVGGLAAGGGALLEWQAVNFGGVRKIYGTDTAFGMAVLVMSVAVIIVTLLTRKGSTEEPRTWGPPVDLVLGVMITLVGVLAASGAALVYDPSRNSEAKRLAAAAGTTVEEVMKVWDEVTRTRIGPGPWLVLAGGFLIIVASIAGLVWKHAWKQAGETEGATEEPAERD